MIQLFRPVEKCPSPFILKKRDGAGNNFNLITQLFGENLADFYAKLGMKAHNGIDFIAPMGTPVYAAHDGEVFKTLDKSNSSPTAGYGVYVRHVEGWWTLYFHLLDVTVKVDDKVKAGDLIGHADNTGQYTTGSHLHFGLYPAVRDNNNGYGGAIDPFPYFSPEQISGIINQPNLNKMELKSYDGNLYLVEESSKFGWSIPNPDILGLVVNHFALIGKPLSQETPFDPTGYFIIKGANDKAWREFLNL